MLDNYVTRHITVNNTPRHVPSRSRSHIPAPSDVYLVQLIDIFHWFKYMTRKKSTWHADNVERLKVKRILRLVGEEKGKLGFQWIVYEGKKANVLVWRMNTEWKTEKYQYLWRFILYPHVKLTLPLSNTFSFLCIAMWKVWKLKVDSEEKSNWF